MMLWFRATIILILMTGPAFGVSLFGDEEVFDEAARDNFTEVEQFLLTGNNVNIRDRKKVPLIHHAAAAGATRTVKVLIKHGAKLDLTDSLGNTALIQAAAYGSEPVINLLLENGAKIDLENRQGETALIKAAQTGSVRSVEVLIEKGASVNISDFTGRTALDHARQNRHREIVRLLDAQS